MAVPLVTRNTKLACCVPGGNVTVKFPGMLVWLPMSTTALSARPNRSSCNWLLGVVAEEWTVTVAW